MRARLAGMGGRARAAGRWSRPRAIPPRKPRRPKTAMTWDFPHGGHGAAKCAAATAAKARTCPGTPRKSVSRSGCGRSERRRIVPGRRTPRRRYGNDGCDACIGSSQHRHAQGRWQHAAAGAGRAVATGPARIGGRGILLRGRAGAIASRSGVVLRMSGRGVRGRARCFALQRKAVTGMLHARHRRGHGNPVQDQCQRKQQMEDEAAHRPARLHGARESFNAADAIFFVRALTLDSSPECRLRSHEE